MFLLRLAAVLFSTLLGGCFGSFLNVAVWRLPAGMSLVRPGSFCPKCGHSIRFRDNIPVFGWIILRGKCRDCGQPISARYPVIEALTALMAAGLSSLFFFGEKGVPAGVFHWNGLSSGFAAIADYLSGASFFLAVTPEEILLKGIGITSLWTILHSIFLGFGLVEWDGKKISPLLRAVEIILPCLLLGRIGLIPTGVFFLCQIGTSLFAKKYRRVSSLLLFVFELAAFTGIVLLL